MLSFKRNDLARFVLLFAALYLSFGVASPFFPVILTERGLTPEQLGFVLSVSTVVRLISGPIGGWIADRLPGVRVVLAICTALAGGAALGLTSTQDLLILSALAWCYAAFLAPTTTLADALALGASARHAAAPHRYEYGWVRGAGSAAFIAGTVLSGQAVGLFGLAAPLAFQAAMLVMASALAFVVPELPRRGDELARPAPSKPSMGLLLRNRAFVLVTLIAAAILGSHAMHDAFAMISWNAAGIGSGIGSLLWSEAVAAEVLVFLWIGPWILRRTSPIVGLGMAAAAAAVRWTAMSQSSSVLVLAAVEPLHGLTFALLHLCCMRILTSVVPPELAATGLAAYALGIGIVSAVLTLLSGSLYAVFGLSGFLAMSCIALLSVPSLWALSRIVPH